MLITAHSYSHKEEYETDRCLECGIDTSVQGYVNRYPNIHNKIAGYTCGGCASWDEARDEYRLEHDLDDDDDWDDTEWDEWHKNEYLPEVDRDFPNAKRFRELIEMTAWSNTDWTPEQKKELLAIMESKE